MPSVELKDLLAAGVHFGHQTQRWNPKMRRYIFGQRNRIHIIDLKRTQACLERALKAKRVDERQLVRYGESFFVSLGLDRLPATFWERSMFQKPRDRDVVCHPSAWDVDYDKDLRVCPSCQRRRVRPWDARRSCPRCGAPMTLAHDSPRVLWD